MPYEIRLVRPGLAGLSKNHAGVNGETTGEYIVGMAILPKFVELHPNVIRNIEDWGWGAWTTHGKYGLSVDVTCSDDAAGEYRVRITSVKRKFLFFQKVVDTAELETLKGAIEATLSRWGCTDIATLKIAERDG